MTMLNNRFEVVLESANMHKPIAEIQATMKSMDNKEYNQPAAIHIALGV